MKAIMILGAAVWRDGPSPTLRRRTQHGAALWRAQQNRVVVCCGGLGRHPPSEAEAMRDILLAEGVKAGAIHLEAASRNTAENIALARPILERLNLNEVILVSDWYHLPRARMVARRAGLIATTSALPLHGARIWPQIKGALREIPAFVAYALGVRR